jgi:hypothetical protein
VPELGKDGLIMSDMMATDYQRENQALRSDVKSGETEGIFIRTRVPRRYRSSPAMRVSEETFPRKVRNETRKREGARHRQREQDLLCNPEVEIDDNDEIDTEFSIEDFDMFIVADPVEYYDLARDEDGRESGAEHDS